MVYRVYMKATRNIRIDREVEAAILDKMKLRESYNAVLRRLLRLDKKNGRQK